MTLREAMSYAAKDVYDTDQAYKYLDTEVIKEFSTCSGGIWLSWKEFGTHKHVKNWWLLKNGIAIGWNENPSIGYSFPVKKLAENMIQKCINHNLTYEQYYNL